MQASSVLQCLAACGRGGLVNGLSAFSLALSTASGLSELRQLRASSLHPPSPGWGWPDGALEARRYSSNQASSSGRQQEEVIDFGFKTVPKDEKVNLVGNVFRSVASSYDVMNDLMSGGMHRLWKDRLVEVLRPFPGMRHLDVAGGTGDVAFRVLRAIRAAEAEEAASSGRGGGGSAGGAGPRGSVVVCDINPAMLEEGRKKAAASTDLAGEAGLTFVEGNAEKLSVFEDNSFDAYTIAFGIRNVTDRDSALREAWRVLKPGGRLLVLEFSRVTDAVPGLRDLYDLYSFNVIPRIGAVVANDAASYQYLVESIRKFPDQEAFACMIEGAGFKAVTYENMMAGIVALHSGFKL